MTPSGNVEHVSDTAYWIAHLRAVESKRADALFHDPLAGVLAGAHGEAIAQTMPLGKIIEWAVVMRTLIIDDFIETGLKDGVEVILNLGAGLDTRPYRMNLPQTLKWIEADYADVIHFKESRLAGQIPRCTLTRISVDLGNESARRAFLEEALAGTKHALILTEGVLPYLSEAEVAALAHDLKSKTQIKGWIVDYSLDSNIPHRRGSKLGRHMKNAPFRFYPKDWIGFFRENGFEATEFRSYFMEGLKYGRRPALPLSQQLMVWLKSRFMSTEARLKMAKAAGYALLRPIASNISHE